MEVGVPNKIINTPEFEPVLRRVFSYHADVYDLEAYERIRPGFARVIWGLVCAERDLQSAQRRFNEPNWFKRVFG